VRITEQITRTPRRAERDAAHTRGRKSKRQLCVLGAGYGYPARRAESEGLLVGALALPWMFAGILSSTARLRAAPGAARDLLLRPDGRKCHCSDTCRQHGGAPWSTRMHAGFALAALRVSLASSAAMTAHLALRTPPAAAALARWPRRGAPTKARESPVHPACEQPSSGAPWPPEARPGHAAWAPAAAGGRPDVEDGQPPGVSAKPGTPASSDAARLSRRPASQTCLAAAGGGAAPADGPVANGGALAAHASPPSAQQGPDGSAGAASGALDACLAAAGGRRAAAAAALLAAALAAAPLLQPDPGARLPGSLAQSMVACLPAEVLP